MTWTDNSSNEGEFLIERDTSSSFSSPVIGSVWSNSTFFSAVNLAPNTTYYFRVRARNATDSSTYSNTATATTLPTAPPPSGYSATVVADSPISYWRLGETSGTVASDERGVNPGGYFNGPLLGQTSLLAGDSANKAVTFDGTNDHVRIASSSPLSPAQKVSLEAWIKPTALPSTGAFASILTKAESYSLQFNGPRLEFTIMQNGTRKRLQAAAGAIVAGQTYHVVGTYDGTTQRLYINGSQVASTALSGSDLEQHQTASIGSWGGTEEFFKGTIDEVAVYGSTLSAARVSAHHVAATPSTQTTALQTGITGFATPVSADRATTGSYSIESPPTFVDYCRLPPRV